MTTNGLVHIVDDLILPWKTDGVDEWIILEKRHIYNNLVYIPTPTIIISCNTFLINNKNNLYNF